MPFPLVSDPRWLCSAYEVLPCIECCMWVLGWIAQSGITCLGILTCVAGKFILLQYPFVARALAPLAPLAALYNSFPFAP